ncbi:DUF4089 domain-containing protein [Acetobacter sp. AN02]|uniref:DUF4089 domain-containing protein n=1 Tax=Acetobacter sp. AN02 TaxID=2894186 RepID=UPI00243431C8|nr:DUF4089 domain-containing protein [Acetobacter sp. AN02]MDG6094766.1 DUF4089 domain-containing protein [Acetobacter sp. AN02]
MTAPENELRLLARQVGLTLPDYALPGVAANTELLRHYMALIEGLPLPDDCEPASEYSPEYSPEGHGA